MNRRNFFKAMLATAALTTGLARTKLSEITHEALSTAILDDIRSTGVSNPGTIKETLEKWYGIDLGRGDERIVATKIYYENDVFVIEEIPARQYYAHEQTTNK